MIRFLLSTRLGEGRWTQADLARATGISPSQIWEWYHGYPDDYPELGTEITVIGTFDLYEEDGFRYTRLDDARVIF